MQLNEEGIAIDFEVEGEFPTYGNNDDRVDSIAVYLVESMINKIRKNKTYRNSIHTQSVLTITSNVVYGKKTGSIPDGRKAGEHSAERSIIIRHGKFSYSMPYYYASLINSKITLDELYKSSIFINSLTEWALVIPMAKLTDLYPLPA